MGEAFYVGGYLLLPCPICNRIRLMNRVKANPGFGVEAFTRASAGLSRWSSGYSSVDLER